MTLAGSPVTSFQSTAASTPAEHGDRADATGGAARTLLLENYAAMPTAFEAHLHELIASIVDRRELPLLISCTAGKDRTGFVCSLLLTALGVGHGQIVADYMHSNEWFDTGAIRRSLAGWLEPGSATEPSDQVLDALRCRPEYLAAAYAAIQQRHGSVEAYLERAGGLNRERLDSLRAALLQ
jgi:protein-tyrosine phosphatase